MSGPSRTTRVIVVLVVLVLVAAGFVALRARSGPSGTIEVTGSASASGTPDTVAFSIGVVTTGASTAAALRTNNARTRALEAALLAIGEPRSGLATSGLNVSSITNAHGQVTGYQVDDELTVTSHRVGHAGALIAAALSAAGNTAQLSGITYSITNQSAVLARARASAMANAHRAASQLASAASTSLGAVRTIVDDESNPPVVLPGVYGFAAVKAASVPVQPGTQSVSVTVRVTYTLR